MGTYEDLAERVLKNAKQPLSVAEILERASASSQGDLIKGETPHKTFHARLSMDIVRNGKASKFVRVAPGVFGLRELVTDNKEISVQLDPGPLLSNRGIPATYQIHESPRRQLRESAEEVIVVANTLIDELDFVGFVEIGQDELTKRFSTATWKVVSRTQADTLSDHRQLISYVVIRRPGFVLTYSRGAPVYRDDLLRGKRAVGVGGHTTYTDLSIFRSIDDKQGLISALRACAAREILEELNIDDRLLQEEASHSAQTERLKIVGLINDESSDIGLKRIAVVFEYEPAPSTLWKAVDSNESGIRAVEWRAPYRDGLNLNEYEYWSVLYFEDRFKSAVQQSQEVQITDIEKLQKARQFCILGGIGSGKSVAAGMLAKKLEGRVVNSGEVLARLMGVPPVPTTVRRDFQIHATKFMSDRDAGDKLAAAIVQEVQKVDEVVVIDGVRNRSTLMALRKHLPSIGIIFISAPPHVAFEFYRYRELENEGALTSKEFMRLLRSPEEFEVQFLARFAHAHVFNWIGMDGYTEKIANLIHVILEN